MPLSCDVDGCNGAVTMTGSNGATDPANDRLETYECEYGHTFSIELEGRPDV